MLAQAHCPHVNVGPRRGLPRPNAVAGGEEGGARRDGGHHPRGAGGLQHRDRGGHGEARRPRLLARPP